MPPSALPQDHRYTWTEYRTWPDDERWEIIGGVAYNLSPAPSTRHQAIVGNCSRTCIVTWPAKAAGP